MRLGAVALVLLLLCNAGLGRLRRAALFMNKVSFEYCTKCRWGLRASWMAQEILTTFQNGEVKEVSLVPIAEPAGTFTVRLNDLVIWDRRDPLTPGFPEAKDLKQRVRDVVAPGKGLGHSENDRSKVIEVADDTREIRVVLQNYLDGLYEGDVNKISEAFHPTCLLTHYNETSAEMRVVRRDEWLDVVRNRPSPQKLGLSRHDSIESIQLISPTTAFVKLRCAIPPRFFTDSLNLLKVDGTWQIAQKLFAVEIFTDEVPLSWRKK